MKRFASFLSEKGIMIISVWFTDKYTNIMESIFSDAEAYFNVLDSVVLSGHTIPKGLKKRIPVSFRVGVFQPKK